MSRIPKAHKEAVLSKMLSPNPPAIGTLAKQEGISEATLYNWRKQLRQEGRSVPEHDRTSENWSAQTKFAVVVETAALTETELAEYCRGKGLYQSRSKHGVMPRSNRRTVASRPPPTNSNRGVNTVSRSNVWSARSNAKTKRWRRRQRC